MLPVRVKLKHHIDISLLAEEPIRDFLGMISDQPASIAAEILAVKA
jgi:hypothetical protein